MKKYIYNVVLLLAIVSPVSAQIQLDQYGGIVGMDQFTETLGNTSYFHIGKFSKKAGGSRWVLVTPDGNAMLGSGVSLIGSVAAEGSDGNKYSDHYTSKYAGPAGPADGCADARDRWSYYARRRLRDWGFSHAGTFTYWPVVHNWGVEPVTDPSSCDTGVLPDNFVPNPITGRAGMWAMRDDGVKNLYASVYLDGWTANPTFPDPFDPAFTTSADTRAQAGFWSTNLWALWIFMDQTDEMRGMYDSHPHLGFLVAASASEVCADVGLGTKWGSSYKRFYTDCAYYAKDDELKTYLEGVYATIGDLNTAWSTSYTTFGTSGTRWVDEQCDSLGDGSKTVFTCTLAHLVVVSNSVQVEQAGTVIAGDDNAGGFYGGSTLTGTNTINYTTGAVTLTFSTPPASSEAVTLTYTEDGWGAGGTGLLDEDGTNLGAGFKSSDPSGNTATQKTDLEAFAVTLVRKWYQTVFGAYQTYKPNHLVITNNMDTPKDYVYDGLRDAADTTTYAHVIVALDTPERAATESAFLERPFTAPLKLSVAMGDSPLSLGPRPGVCVITAFQTNDGDSTVTVTTDDNCDFWWCDNALDGTCSGPPNFSVDTYYQFSSLPADTGRCGGVQQKYRANNSDWRARDQLRVREVGFCQMEYEDLRDAIEIGDTFRRVDTLFWPEETLERQEDRGIKYREQVLDYFSRENASSENYYISVNWWSYADTAWLSYFEGFNFGLLSIRDNPYDGEQATAKASPADDENGFARILEDYDYGNFMGYIKTTNFGIQRRIFNEYFGVIPVDGQTKIQGKGKVQR
ncbi:MAG: hypothetical protein V3W37_10385 [Candidatus Binatia bacterium]